ncbi:hypothetical protein [Ammoniphilus oxalaticus]|uniref:hypothetical protein n=1 Tax=Ammoniphilus oxalaticus TaxID=66863 RepID=UPI0014761F7B|nr:hypothetical protein [Ammoniphilus oxalaticus]
MSGSIFDPRQRMELIRKLLKDKIQLREWLDRDIRELQQSLQDIEEMIVSERDKVTLT